MRTGWIGALAALLWWAPSTASAFCGFYAGSATGELTASASRVVLVRDGTRTVLTMQNRYEGPPEHFAMVVPVPEVIQQEQVRALEPEIFERLDVLTAPRIVEYQERAPRCPTGRSARVPRIRAGSASLGVTVEAEFSTAEYDIVVLSASDSSGLETWLRAHHYQVPEGAGDALRPYVQAGTKFFVARVDVSRVRFVDGHAELSPLRVYYDSPQLTLPVRLGVLNSEGTQDLIVYVLAREQRYEVANRRNYFAPTNVVVAPGAIPRFGELYEHLFDRMMTAHPDSVVTEYAWRASSCDPCPSPPLAVRDLNALGGDVISGAEEEPAGDGHIRILGLERLSGRGGSEEGLRAGIERHLENAAPCIAGWATRPGEVRYELDLVLRRDGRVGVTRASLEGNGTPACLARRLRGTRVNAPPLGVDDSRWRLTLTPYRELIRRQRGVYGFTLTRLRTRTRKTGRVDDLVFREARPVTGGRGEPGEHGHLPQRAQRGEVSTFQSRFVVLHRTTATAPCDNPVHGGWGSRPPRSSTAPSPEDPDASGPVEGLLRSEVHALGVGRRRRGGPRKRAGPKPR